MELTPHRQRARAASKESRQMLRRFLGAVFDDTVVLLSGTSSVILLAITALIPSLEIPARWIVWTAGSVCLLVASFRMWRNKENELDIKNREITELKDMLSNPNRQKRIHALEDHLTSGKARADIITNPYTENAPQSKAFMDCLAWCNAVGGFLNAELPQYWKRFRDCSVKTNIENVDGARSLYTVKIRELESILKDFSATQS
jgi:hypothetical protein